MSQQPLFQLSGIDQIIPVHGIEGAKAYSMGPSCRVPLFDDTEDILYIKSTDVNGFPTLRIFDFTERKVIDENKGVSLNDIRSIIKEELSSYKEELINGQQFVSEPKYSAAIDTSSINNADATKHDAKSHYYTKPKQPKSNSSIVANGEK